MLGAGTGVTTGSSAADKQADAARHKETAAQLQAAIDSAPVDAEAKATLKAGIQATLQQVASPEKARIQEQFHSTQSQVILAIRSGDLVLAQALVEDMQWMTLATGVAAPAWTEAQRQSLTDAINNGVVAARRNWWDAMVSAKEDALNDALDQSKRLRQLAAAVGVTPQYAEGASIPAVDGVGRQSVIAAAKGIYADMLADSPHPATATARWQFLRDHADYWLKGHVSDFAGPIRSDLQQAEYRRWQTLSDDSLSLADRRRQIANLDDQIKVDAGVVKALGLGDLLTEAAIQKTITDGKESAVAYANAVAARMKEKHSDIFLGELQAKLDFLAEYGIKPTVAITPGGGGGDVDLSSIFKTPQERLILEHTKSEEGPGKYGAAWGAVVYRDNNMGQLLCDRNWLNFGLISFAFPSGSAGSVQRAILSHPGEEDVFRSICAKYLKDRSSDTVPAGWIHLLKNQSDPTIAAKTTSQLTDEFLSLVKAGDDGAARDWFFKYLDTPTTKEGVATGDLRDDWTRVFQEFLSRPASQYEQLKAAYNQYFQPARDMAERLGLTTMRGVGFMFDTYVQHGGLTQKMRDLLKNREEEFANASTVHKMELLRDTFSSNSDAWRRRNDVIHSNILTDDAYQF